MRFRKPLSPRRSQSVSGRKVTCTEEARRPLAKRDQPCGESLLRPVRVRAGPHQQPRSASRRERHRDLQFGIIAAAGTLISVGPALIEDVFAARMRFQVAGRSPKRFALRRLDQKVLRRPAGSRDGRPDAPVPTEKRAKRKGWQTNLTALVAGHAFAEKLVPEFELTRIQGRRMRSSPAAETSLRLQRHDLKWISDFGACCVGVDFGHRIFLSRFLWPKSLENHLAGIPPGAVLRCSAVRTVQVSRGSPSRHRPIRGGRP